MSAPYGGFYSKQEQEDVLTTQITNPNRVGSGFINLGPQQRYAAPQLTRHGAHGCTNMEVGKANTLIRDLIQIRSHACRSWPVGAQIAVTPVCVVHTCMADATGRTSAVSARGQGGAAQDRAAPRQCGAMPNQPSPKRITKLGKDVDAGKVVAAAIDSSAKASAVR